jgi:SAM-dependent methyltransferase
MIGNVDQWGSYIVSGWIADPNHPDRVMTLDLKIDGKYACTITAGLCREDLNEVEVLHGHYKHGFSIDPRPYLKDGMCHAELFFGGGDQLFSAGDINGAEANELFIRSQERWKGDEAPDDLTWGYPMKGDSFIDIIRPHWPICHAAKIVEVGPGYGRLLSTILQRKIPFGHYCGVDISAARVARLNSNFGADRIKFEFGDINTHAFGCRVDVVFSSSTFVHLFPDCYQSLRNIIRQVSRDALLAIDFLDPEQYSPGSGFEPTNGTYVRCYSRDELRQMFENTGHQVTSMTRFVIGVGSDLRSVGEIFGLIVIARAREAGGMRPRCEWSG